MSETIGIQFDFERMSKKRAKKQTPIRIDTSERSLEPFQFAKL